MQFLQKAATFMNKLVVAVKRAGDEAGLPCRITESNIREEYVLQKDEDGEMSFAAVWNIVETKVMNGELVAIFSVRIIIGVSLNEPHIDNCPRARNNGIYVSIYVCIICMQTAVRIH